MILINNKKYNINSFEYNISFFTTREIILILEFGQNENINNLYSVLQKNIN